MTYYVGLDVSQKMTAICVVNEVGHRLWRGQCRSVPSEIEASVRRHAGTDARIGLETGPMTPWLAHELRNRHLDVVCLDEHAGIDRPVADRHRLAWRPKIGCWPRNL